MPRKSRIDAPGAVHHIMARGIEKAKIFKDTIDRENFLQRLGKIIESTKTSCYAWALLPNHFHLLLKTGDVPISTVMRKLLTGYAVSFNKRYKRSGHLFQNRYKSILCQEQSYLLELIRYIHLNPLRAKLMESYSELGSYPYCGHSAIKGQVERKWQDSKYVLSLFAESMPTARKRYCRYVEEGMLEGKRDDLTGGGLIRSYGGWNEVRKLRKRKNYQMGDERILGDGPFVEKALAHAEEFIQNQNEFQKAETTHRNIADVAARKFDLKPQQIYSKGKQRQIVKARNLFCYWSKKELDISMTELSRLLNVSVSAISQSYQKGKELCQRENWSLIEELKL
ncbi:MAG: transposase [Proteobacteria bacterium]|nr:transposase [Pseudomonadota bacterium]